MKFKTIKAYYGSVTLYRVVKQVAGELDTIHIYNNEHTAQVVTKTLNASVNLDEGQDDV